MKFLEKVRGLVIKELLESGLFNDVEIDNLKVKNTVRYQYLTATLNSKTPLSIKIESVNNEITDIEIRLNKGTLEKSNWVNLKDLIRKKRKQ